MKNKVIILVAIIISGFILLNTGGVVLAASDPLVDVCQGKAADSAACKSRRVDNPFVGPNGVITRITQIIVMAVGVVSVIMLMIGGTKYIVSSGDPAKVNNAKDTILYALVGLVVAILAQTIVSFVLSRL